MRLFMFRNPKQPISGSPATSAAGAIRARPGRVRDPPEPPRVAGLASPLRDEAGVDDQAVRAVEDVAGERETLGLRLPEERQQVVEHAEAEQAARRRRARAPSRRGSRGRRRGRS